MTLDLDIAMESATVVLVGDFNPAIFQPAWFAHSKLIPDQQATAAEVRVIQKNVASFKAEWLDLEVTRDRFQAWTEDPGHFPLLRDLVVGTLRILRHTPCRALGINRSLHVALSSHDQWHAIGDKLAPKELWNSAMSTHGKKLDRQSTGLLSLSILGNRPGSNATGVTAVIEPSNRIPDGIFFSTNEDFKVASTDEAIANVNEAWNAALAFPLSILEKILDPHPTDG